MASRLFVTGTDTNIGKTLVSAWLCHHGAADYWKPIQSGTADGTDTNDLSRLVPGVRCHPSTYVLSQPLSPHESARCDGVTIELDRFCCPDAERLVVEGAGGVMVPINEHQTMLDVMVHLGLPVLLVARSELGTINHTLLSLMALRQRGLEVLGVVMSGPPSTINREAIEQFGQVRVLAEIPRLERVDAQSVSTLPRPDFFA